MCLNAKIEKAFNATTAGQKRMCQNADERIRIVLRTFNEVQTGPNPLTLSEVEQLIKMHPERYSILRSYCEARRKRGDD
jgi:hypothetical protein